MAKLRLGYTEEADAFMLWRKRTTARRAEDLQVVYGVGKERFLPELVFEGADGDAGARPVRLGSEASGQFQLDGYGDLLDAAWSYRAHGGDIDEESWSFFREVVDVVTERASSRAIAIPTDVSDAEAVERAASQEERAFGSIDVWVNNAMTTVFSPFVDRMGKRSQPIPPIFQPEGAAEAVVFAVEHPRREIYVGAFSVKAIWGNRVAPWLADRVLAKQGYEKQLTDEPEDPIRPSNLSEPVPGDHGAHGRFDADSKPRSLELWMTRHRRGLGFLAATLVAGGLTLALARRTQGM